MSSSSVSAPVDTPIKAPFSIDFEGLEKDIEQGKDARLLFLLGILSKSTINHPLMANDPASCYRFAKLLVKAGAIKPLPPQLIEDLLTRFSEHKVFSRLELKEDLEVKCRRGKEVKFDDTMLALSGESFRQQIAEQGMVLASSKTATALLAWKSFVIIRDVDTKAMGLSHLTELYAIALQNQASSLAEKSKGWVFSKMKRRFVKEKTLHHYVRRLPSYGLPEDEQNKLEVQALVEFLQTSKITTKFSLDKRHICLSGSHLDLLEEDNSLGKLLRKHVNGIFLTNPGDLSEASLFGINAEEELFNQIIEINLEIGVGGDELKHLAGLFPSVETLTLCVDVFPEHNFYCSGLEEFLQRNRDLRNVSWCEAKTLERYMQVCSSLRQFKQMQIVASPGTKVGIFHEPGEENVYKPLLVSSGSYYLCIERFQVDSTEVVKGLKDQLKFTTFEKLPAFREEYLINSYSFFLLYTQNLQESS